MMKVCEHPIKVQIIDLYKKQSAADTKVKKTATLLAIITYVNRIGETCDELMITN